MVWETFVLGLECPKIFEGRLRATDMLPMNGSSHEELLAITAAVKQQSSHPIARAVVTKSRNQNLSLPASSGMENLPGRGMSMLNGQPVLTSAIHCSEKPAGTNRTTSLKNICGHWKPKARPPWP